MTTTHTPLHFMIEGLVHRPDLSGHRVDVFEAAPLNPVGEALYYVKETVNSNGDRTSELLALLPDGTMPNQADNLPGRMQVRLDRPSYTSDSRRVTMSGSSWDVETDYEAEILVKALELMRTIRTQYELL